MIPSGFVRTDKMEIGGFEMKGEQIADLIVEWANERNMHPDDFNSLFVDELLELLEKDKKEEM